MDANNSYQYKNEIDKDMQAFMLDAHLVKRSTTSSRYHRKPMCGVKRFDWALVNISNVLASHNIGYLGTYEGADSKHVVGSVDWDKEMFSQGLMNQPVHMQGRPTKSTR
jgi:hypothetical protein